MYKCRAKCFKFHQDSRFLSLLSQEYGPNTEICIYVCTGTEIKTEIGMSFF